MNPSINKKIAVGAGWMLSLRWVDRLIGLISIAILARLLLPADFGIAGYAMVFLATLEQFSQFNFKTILIRDLDATEEQYNTAWTLEIIKGFVLAAIMVASAKSVASFFGEPEVEGILYWTAGIPILRGLVNVGIVDFQKNLELHKEFYLNLIVRLAATITTIILAFKLRNYWALVFGGLVQPFVRLILSYLMNNFRPRLCLSETSRLMGFSTWLLIQNIFSSIYHQLPVIAIGRFLDAQALAFFNMAKELTSVTTAQFAAPIRHALFPGISKMQNDHTQMENTIKSALGIIVMIGLPITIGIGVTAPLLVPAFLGNNWFDVAAIVAVLSLSAAIHMFYPNSHLIFYALNRPKITAYITLLRLCMLIPTILLVVPKYGVIGAAWALVAINGIMTVVDYSVLSRMTGIKLSHIISVIWRSVFAVTLMALCVKMAIDVSVPLFGGQSNILRLLFCIGVGAVTYIATVVILWWLGGAPNGPEAYVLRTMRSLYDRGILLSKTRRNSG